MTYNKSGKICIWNMHCVTLPSRVFIVEARRICLPPTDIMVFLGFKRSAVVEQWKKLLQKTDLLESYIIQTLSKNISHNKS